MAEDVVILLLTRFLTAVVAQALSFSPGKSGVWSLSYRYACPGLFVSNCSLRLLCSGRALPMLPRRRNAEAASLGYFRWFWRALGTKFRLLLVRACRLGSRCCVSRDLPTSTPLSRRVEKMEPFSPGILNCIARLEVRPYFPNAAAEIPSGLLHEKRRRQFGDV